MRGLIPAHFMARIEEVTGLRMVDMVDIFRKPSVMDMIVEQCITRGDVKVVWSQIGIVNNEAAQKAKDAKIHMVQNQCAMADYRSIMEE